MFLSVIFTCIMVTGNDNHHAFQRGNLLVTVRHIESHISEVIVIVGELTCCQTHFTSSHVGSRSSGIAAEDNVRLCVQRFTDFYIISHHRVLLSIVHIGVMVARDCHVGVNLIDGQRTVFHLKNHMIVIIASSKVIGAQTHAVCASIRADCYRIGRSDNFIFRHGNPLRQTHGITTHLLFATIIVRSTSSTSNAYNSISLCNTEGTISNHNIIIGIVAQSDRDSIFTHGITRFATQGIIQNIISDQTFYRSRQDGILFSINLGCIFNRNGNGSWLNSKDTRLIAYSIITL